jgi:hypothetical protein
MVGLTMYDLNLFPSTKHLTHLDTAKKICKVVAWLPGGGNYVCNFILSEYDYMYRRIQLRRQDMACINQCRLYGCTLVSQQFA